jgi:hypothetical protein
MNFRAQYVVLHFAVFLLFCLNDNLFGQSEELERRRQELQQKALKWSANLQAIKDRVRQESMAVFRVADDWQLIDAGHRITVVVGDFRRYQLLSDAKISGFVFAGSKVDSLIKRSQELEKEWPEKLRVYQETGEMAVFDAIVQKLNDYESELQAQATEQQKRMLDQLRLRDIVLINGVHFDSLEQVLDISELPATSKMELSKELEALRLELCGEYNQLLVHHLEKIFPGFIDARELRLPQEMVLPIGLFLELAATPDVCRRDWKKLREGTEVNPLEGRFVFPSQSVQFRPGGQVRVVQRSLNSAAPASVARMVMSNANGDLAEYQLPSIESVLGLNLRPGDGADSAQKIRQLASDPVALKKMLLETAIKENEAIEAALTPRQMAGVANYVRFHALFTIGPHVIYDELDSQTRPSSEAFELGLKQLREEYAKTCNAAVDRYSSIMTRHKLDSDWLAKYKYPEFPMAAEFLLRPVNKK